MVGRGLASGCVLHDGLKAPRDLKEALSNKSSLLLFIKMALAELGITNHGEAYSQA
jgi:hypothetical protein